MSTCVDIHFARPLLRLYAFVGIPSIAVIFDFSSFFIKHSDGGKKFYYILLLLLLICILSFVPFFLDRPEVISKLRVRMIAGLNFVLLPFTVTTMSVLSILKRENHYRFKISHISHIVVRLPGKLQFLEFDLNYVNYSFRVIYYIGC